MRKKDFPALRPKKPIYLDTAATSQKPQEVIEAMRHYLTRDNAPIHRALYPLAERATALFEGARESVADFIGAADAKEVVFTRNATEAINIVAQAWGRANVRQGDEILVTRMEHHANFVPWLVLAKAKGAKFRIAELTKDGRLDLSDFKKKLSSKTRVVGVAYVSNVLGTVNPVSEIRNLVRKRARNAVLVVDAAQSAAHLPMDVQRLDCDFLAFSGHKLYGPTGIGVLWGRGELLQGMPPFLTGGQMIKEVTDTAATWNEIPWKFEAGTPDAAGAVGLGAATDYIKNIGWERIVQHERGLLRYALGRFADPQIRRAVAVYGPRRITQRSGVIAFTVRGVHAHDVASLLAEEGIAIRAGHHCAMPLHTKLGVAATARISFGVYNERRDVDVFFQAFKRRVLPLVRDASV